MEALHSHSCLPTGEQSGVHDQPQPGESALPLPDPQPPKSPSSQNHEPQTQQTRSKQGGPQQQQQQQQQQHHGQHHKLPNKRERKRLRHQRQSVDSDTPPAEDGKHAKAEATPTRVARTSSGGTRATPSSSSTSTQSTEAPDTEENQEGTLKQKRERKPGKPGKYVCSYCGRACAKPSVLQKHIRSHTGERPYPCAPCGFSFKTKSNLYKHRKSHTHRVKAGLASGEPSALEEPVPESEDETREPLSAASSNMERQGSVANEKTHEDTERSTEQSSGMDNSYAVKKRLAMRLSRGKRGPLGSSDSISSSMGMGSRGSTESGYFSRSESTEQSQDSPPNVTKSAKSYAEIILGKYGRLGHLQRMSRHQDQQPSGSQGQQEKSIPFTVPKKQVIDHITNLITINEAVVDTSKIDSVKPRRFSLSRRSSTESKVSLSLKESPVVHHSTNNPGDPGFKSSGSITMGVPCEKFHHHQSLHVDSTAGQTSTSMAPLLRSLSMPSAASSTDASSGACPRNFRLSQSFDERSETQSRHIGMLRRQPAIELGAEFNKEEHSLHSSSNTLYNHNMSIVPPDHKQCQPEPYECETCGVGCKNWEGYKAHKRSLCIARLPQESLGTTICQLDRSQLIHYPINRPGVLAMRKRRKEESFESDDPSSPVSIPTLSTLVQGRDERSVACNRNSWSRLEQDWGGTSKGFSVIQHTSSFEKQDTLFTESQGKEEAHIQFPSHEDASQKQLQEHSSKPTPRKLVRQRNVQVPEIFITEDSNTNVIESVQTQSEMASIMPKQTKRTEEFQWPQRSLTLSGVPIEKLPPKKKRIRLAEAAQSSGESMSSFDSISLPRSPSQDSCASHASSRSASFEESTRPGDMETLAGIPLRRSRAPNMLTVPGLHHHKREMRRSASEQAPHDPQQQSVLMAMSEMRSKSFDYSSLSPERSAAGWRDRRKCLLMRHTPVRDPEEEEQPAKPAELKQNPSSCIIAKHTALKVNNPSHCSPSPDPVSPNTLSRQSPGPQHLSSAAGSPLSGVTSCNPVQTLCGEPPSQWKLDQSIQLTGHCFEVLPSQKSVESPDPLQRVAPSPLCSGKPVIISLRPVHTYIHPAQTRPVYPPLPLPTQCPLGIARAHYLPISTGLKLEIPVPTHRHDGHSEFVTHPPQILHPHPNITLSPELLRPSISPAVAVVRLQADTNTLASAIYTTLSQTTTYRSQEPVCSALNSGNRNTLTSEHNSHLVKTLPVSIKRLSETLLPVSQLTLPPGNHLALPLPPGSQLWSEEGCRSSGSGSYKRMLSPSNSVDFSPESKQQQKRVKEEEEESCVGNVIAETSSKEEKVEIPTCLPRVCTPISPEGPSYPTLQSTTSHSWCYLNYVKPNPSTSTDQPSVYSSWSTSEYDSNPPGLSTKTALSLLDCKQRVSYTIYTMSPMSSTPAETTPEPADMKTPCPSEVHATLPGDSHRVETTEQEQSAEDKEPKKEREEEEEKEEKEKEEEAQSTSKCREPPPRIWICEGGYRSSEEYVYVRGRGRGRYVCEECGIRCKKPSMLHKHIRLHTDSRPYVCKHCNFAFKTKGNLTKHMKSKAHGKKCHDGPMTGSSLEEAEEGGSEDCLVWPETGQGEHQHSDVSETEEDDDDNEYDDEDDDGEEESWSHEDPSSTSHLKPPKPPNQNRTTPDRDRTRPSGSSQPSQPQRLNPQEPSLCYLAGSPSKKRALFSRRRHLDCAGHRSPRHCPSPTLSPSHRLSSSPAPALSPSPSHRLSSSPAPALSPSPSHRLSSSPAPALSPSPSHRLSSSPALSPSPSHCLSSSPAPALSPSPSHRLSSSPSQHLSSSPSHRLSSSPSHRLSSSPAPALSPSHHLSPAHSLSPRVDLSPLRCPSPRHNLSAVSCHPSHPPLSSLPPSHKLSPAPCHPSPPSSLSLLGCHVSPSLERHPSSLRGLSPIRPKSPSSGSSAPQVTIPAQHRTCLPRDPSSNPHRDRPATATSSKARLMQSYSVQEDDELRPPLLSPRTRPSRGGQGGVLSHLPLHSQQLARTANLLIPIGGIHMVQPRTSPLYSLVTSPVAAKDTPTPARMDQSMTAQNTPTPSEMDRSRIRRAGLDEVPLSWPSSLKDHQNSLKEAARPSTSMHTSYQGNRVGEGEAGAKCRQSTPLPDKAGMAHVHVCTMRPENHGSLSRREETKLLFTGTEVAGSSHTTGTRTSTLSKGTTPTERDTDTHFREGSVFPVTTQGQKALPSFQTKL